MRATSRAERKAKVEKSKKKRSTPYSRPSTSVDNGNNSGGVKSVRRPGVCYNCYKPGHWQFECPEKNKKLSTHINDLNEMGVNLHESDLYDLKAYTDASDIGFGGFVVPAIDSNSAESVCDSSDVQMNSSLITPRNSLHTVVGSWADHERIKSSTWRELEAVNRTVKSSLHLLKNQTLQINTDNKNVTSIVKNGSRKTDLQATLLYVGLNSKIAVVIVLYEFGQEDKKTRRLNVRIITV
ncbi:unnamed protein product [Mytilus edulis]|uniref:CCHC-type domain-containing protein n=1 Tax=Mytilus edulis TaxID=6550 RepID=A0A8S3RKU7_MYTED|nr:unnamed protein product [Mytilus edulis]